MSVQLGDAVHEPLTTKEGWARFVDAEPVAPPELSRDQALALDQHARGAYDEQRLDHHSRLAIVATPAIRQVTSTGRRLMLLNCHQVSARRGLIVTGPTGTGKTTAVTQLGRSHERAVRRHHPGDRLRLPVIYVTVPPVATARMLAVEFARFLGLPLTRHAPTRPMSPTPCAGCSAICGPTWSSSTKSTT